MDTSILSLIERLPLDIINLISIRLKLINIINFCRSSKTLYRYLKNPQLWKFKLEYDYDNPLIEKEKLIPFQYYAKYIMEYAINIELTAASTLKQYKETELYIDIKKKINDIRMSTKKTDKLKEKELTRNKHNIRNKYKDISISLYNKAFKCSQYARKEIPLTYNIQYIEINIDMESMEKLNKLVDNLGSTETYEAWNCDKLFNQISDVINRNLFIESIGSLLCIKYKNIKIFIYVYELRYNLAISVMISKDKIIPTFMLPYELTNRFLFKDIHKMYNFPFKIEEDNIEYWKWHNDISLMDRSVWKVIPSSEDCRYIRIDINKKQYKQLFKLANTSLNKDLQINDKIKMFLNDSRLYNKLIFPNNLFGFHLDKEHPCILIYSVLLKLDEEEISFVQIPALKNIDTDFSCSVISNPSVNIPERELPSELLLHYSNDDIIKLYNLPFGICN